MAKVRLLHLRRLKKNPLILIWSHRGLFIQRHRSLYVVHNIEIFNLGLYVNPCPDFKSKRIIDLMSDSPDLRQLSRYLSNLEVRHNIRWQMRTYPPHSPPSPISIYDLIYSTRGLIYTIGILVVETIVPLFGYCLKEQVEKNYPIRTISLHT